MKCLVDLKGKLEVKRFDALIDEVKAVGVAITQTRFVEVPLLTRNLKSQTLTYIHNIFRSEVVVTEKPQNVLDYGKSYTIILTLFIFYIDKNSRELFKI